jgi:hypothetical protein
MLCCGVGWGGSCGWGWYGMWLGGVGFGRLC